MPWFTFSLNKEEIKQGKYDKAREDFANSYSAVTKVTAPKHLALFGSDVSLSGSITLFLHVPPQIEHLLKPYLLLYSATSCDKPLAGSLLFGEQEDKDLISR